MLRRASALPCLLALVPGALALGATPATAQEDHSGLTRESFRRNCLMCHSKAAPEGISPEIMAGLHPVPGLTPRAAMPNLLCWRRCEACKLPAAARARSAGAGGR